MIIAGTWPRPGNPILSRFLLKAERLELAYFFVVFTNVLASAILTLYNCSDSKLFNMKPISFLPNIHFYKYYRESLKRISHKFFVGSMVVIPQKNHLRPPDADFYGIGPPGSIICFSAFHWKCTHSHQLPFWHLRTSPTIVLETGCSAHYLVTKGLLSI